MNHLFLFVSLGLFLSAAFHRLDSEKLGILVENTHCRFTSNVSNPTKLDLGNMRAVYCSSSGRIENWQQLRHGRGGTIDRSTSGIYEGSTNVRLESRYVIDDNHVLAIYFWEWARGSSSQSVLVQVLESRDGNIVVTQQIEAEAHGLGAEARFDSRTEQLTVKASVSADTDAHCCPSSLGIVTFRWNGQKFVAINGRKVPAPKQD
jgi:hypothetical protein